MCGLGGRKAGSFVEAGVPDCDEGFEQRLVNLVRIHHTCDSEPEKIWIIRGESSEKKGKGGREQSGKRDGERCSRTTEEKMVLSLFSFPNSRPNDTGSHTREIRI